MKSLTLLFVVLILHSLPAVLGAAVVYKVTFDHGVAFDGIADYTAAAGDVLPAGVHGVLLNIGQYPDAARRTGNLISPEEPGSQGGQALNMMLAGAWPNKQGYYFGRDNVPNGDNYGTHTYPSHGCPDPIGEAGPTIQNEFTIEVVVRPDYSRNPGLDFGLTSHSAIYDSTRLDGVAGGAALVVDQNTGRLTYVANTSGGIGDIQGNTPLQAGHWYHVAVVVRRGPVQRTELWVNGALDAIGVYPVGWETQGLFRLPGYFTIGSSYWPTGGNNWQGQIDALAIGDRALSPGSFALPVPPDGPRPRGLEFGRQWIRDHPFLLFGWSVAYANYLYNPLLLRQYEQCGMTSVLLPYPNESSIAAGRASGLIWQGQPWVSQLTQEFVDLVDAVSAPDDDNAWYLYDEPPISLLPGIGEVASWLRSNRPNMLVYLNVHSGYGDSGITQILDAVRPDVLMYDVYPFANDGSFNANQFFGQLMYFRGKTAARGIPLLSWMQCFTSTSENFAKMPSESQIRTQAFASLAAGCKGLGYFIYDSNDGAGYAGLVRTNGSTHPLYDAVADMNAEIANLGAALKSMDSTDVRFVPGPGSSVPSGLASWSIGAGGDTHITGVAVNPGQSVPFGNGLISFFVDDRGERYFMLTNLAQAGNLSSSQTALAFSVTFDAATNQLLRLNRGSGEQEVVALSGHVLNVTLPGGTGDLFKYDTGSDFSTGRGRVRGFASLAGLSGAGFPIGITAQFRVPGESGALFARQLFTGPDGAYSIPDIAPGSYDILFKASGSLAKRVAGVSVLDSAVVQVDVVLPNGDLNGDNQIDSSDCRLVVSGLDLRGDQ